VTWAEAEFPQTSSGTRSMTDLHAIQVEQCPFGVTMKEL
jgi:aminoglycoside phosphotransferase